MELADGLTYEKRRWHDSDLHVLDVDLSKRQIRPIPVGPDYPAYRYYQDGTRPAQLAQGAGAYASVGSDYTATRFAGEDVPLTSQPIGALMVNGELWTSGQRGSGMFVVKQGRSFITGAPLDLEIVRTVDGRQLTVDGLNVVGDPQGVTLRGGTNVEVMDPKDLGDSGWSLVVLSAVTAAGGGHRVVMDPSTPLAAGMIAIQSEHPLGLEVGDDVVWTRTINGDGALQQIVSGNPIIVRNGINVVPQLDLIAKPPPGPDNWFVRTNPRTCLGVSPDGRRAFVVAVEGRIATSEGMRLKELATFMRQLGASDALNLDGGGSTHMWTRKGGLVCDSCYGNGTLAGTRPQAYATAVF